MGPAGASCFGGDAPVRQGLGDALECHSLGTHGADLVAEAALELRQVAELRKDDLERQDQVVVERVRDEIDPAEAARTDRLEDAVASVEQRSLGVLGRLRNASR